ncbi:MAG: hypothetical protein K2M08_05610 [Anaeroplasmataceae bacterium]|nr:hypothetical protein [Anaeroplasmataceae bacterium]
MEKKDIAQEETKKKIDSPWKKFFKDQIFLMIVGILAFIIYLIIYFLKNDIVYLYLSICTPCIIIIWIGMLAVYMVLKENKKKKCFDQTSED